MQKSSLGELPVIKATPLTASTNINFTESIEVLITFPASLFNPLETY